MPSDEFRYHLLKQLESNPTSSQRGLALQFSISLGKLNYSLNTLIREGWIEVEDAQCGKNKTTHRYRLTPAGLREKALLTQCLLQSKQTEFEALEQQIRELRREAAGSIG